MLTVRISSFIIKFPHKGAVINYWGEGGPVNFWGWLCFFGRPFGMGHNFMGPRLGEGYNSGRLSLKLWARCINGFCAIDFSMARESSQDRILKA